MASSVHPKSRVRISHSFAPARWSTADHQPLVSDTRQRRRCVADRKADIAAPPCLLVEPQPGHGAAACDDVRVAFRTLLFLSMVITPSVIALVFTTLYAPDYGLLFGLFDALGMADSFLPILGDPSSATRAVLPWLIPLFVVLAMITLWPPVTTWLPDMLMSP